MGNGEMPYISGPGYARELDVDNSPVSPSLPRSPPFFFATLADVDDDDDCLWAKDLVDPEETLHRSSTRSRHGGELTVFPTVSFPRSPRPFEFCLGLVVQVALHRVSIPPLWSQLLRRTAHPTCLLSSRQPHRSFHSPSAHSGKSRGRSSPTWPFLP